MNYYYNWSYCDKKDEFFAFIDGGTKESQTIFQIDDTEEVCGYIRTGKMSHIDDVSGLEDHLKALGIIQNEDSLLVCNERMW